MDHTLHERLEPAELTEDILRGAVIYDPEDEKIGNISHLHLTGPTPQVVVDVGGFLGIGTKPVALPVSALNFMRDEDGNVHATTALTKEAVRELPEHRD